MPIGTTTKNIKSGSYVHIHNIRTTLDDLKDYIYHPKFKKLETNLHEKKIKVYKRENGKVGIRNELWIVPTVGCVNETGSLIINEFIKQTDISKIDGVYVFNITTVVRKWVKITKIQNEYYRIS